MKRTVILFVIMGMLTGSIASAEAKNRPRRVERTVVGSYGPYPAPVTGCNSALGPFACLILDSHSKESFFTAKVTDAHGQPVSVEVSGDYGFSATFCGETARPVRFPAGSTLEFDLGARWFTSLHCPANRIKTTGTISVTLSNLP
jgi:hypothetical protein